MSACQVEPLEQSGRAVCVDRRARPGVSAEDIDCELAALGYRCLHRSPDAGNYLRGDERVDFIYAGPPRRGADNGQPAEYTLSRSHLKGIFSCEVRR
jgi:hypothetical protein